MPMELSDRRISVIPACIVAVVAVFLIFVMRTHLHFLYGDRALFLLYTPAIVVASLLGGLVPGGLAIAASCALVTMTDHIDLSRQSDFTYFMTFVAVGASIAGLGEGFLRSSAALSSKSTALVASEAQLRTILETAFDPAVVTNSRGVIVAYNPAARRQFGYEDWEVIGRNMSILMPDPGMRHDGDVRRYGEAGERGALGVDRVIFGRRKDGSTFPMKLAVGETLMPQERFFIGFISDLTEQEETAARFERLQNELARLSRLNELGEMASTLAHEINQPLAATMNYVQGSRQLLRDIDTPEAEKARLAMEEATRQALRVGDIVRHLREYVVRGETQKFPESLHALIEGAAGLALLGSRDMGVRTEFRLLAPCDRVLVDRVQIQQVLINLMRNALDAMRETPRRELRITTRNQDGRFIRIEICDTGPGISAAAAQRLFQPFSTTKKNGIGVGLSISRRLVLAHDGELMARNGEYGGAVFAIILPVLPEQGVSDDG